MCADAVADGVCNVRRRSLVTAGECGDMRSGSAVADIWCMILDDHTLDTSGRKLYYSPISTLGAFFCERLGFNPAERETIQLFWELNVEQQRSRI